MLLNKYSWLLIFVELNSVVLINTQSTGAPDVSASSVPASDLCTCDLTLASCDINCCCDRECSKDEIELFTGHCLDRVLSAEPRHCYDEAVVFDTNTPYEVRRQEDTGLFCIYTDNYEERLTVRVPDTLPTESEFLSTKSRFANIGFAENPSASGENFSLPTRYGSGSLIYGVTADTQVLFQMSLPYGALSDKCSGKVPLEFFQQKRYSCRPMKKSLQDQCESDQSLGAKYYFERLRILKSPKSLHDLQVDLDLDAAIATLHPSEFIKITTTVDGNPVVEDTMDNLTPKYNSDQGTCEGLVEKVKYTFVVNATAGIVSVELNLQQTTLNSDQFLLSQQHFNVEFKWEDEKESALRRSGNPGYVVGQPVMAGRLLMNDTDEALLAIDLDQDPQQWLTVIRSADCGDAEPLTAPIRFQFNLSAGCLIDIPRELTPANCAELQKVTVAALNRTYKDRVAAYANASITMVGDWISVDAPKLPSDTETPCTIVTGLDVVFFFAETGPIVEPQAKIVGVKYTFRSTKLQFRCMGAFCTEAGAMLSQRMPVTVTVTWSDVTGSYESAVAQLPKLDLRLPSALFYPFTASSTPPTRTPDLIRSLVLLCCLCRLFS